MSFASHSLYLEVRKSTSFGNHGFENRTISGVEWELCFDNSDLISCD